MEKLIPLALIICFAVLTSARENPATKDELEDLKPEESRRRIYEIIQSHEGRKYGDHGGHEYEEGELPLKAASRKRYGYLPAPVLEGKTPVYYEAAPNLPKDNVYRENVAAYASGKDGPIHLGNAPHRVIASPVSHSHYAVVDPQTHNQYVVFDDPKSHHKRPVVLDPKASYILEEEPHYVVPQQEIVVKSPAVSYAPQYHHPVAKDYGHYNKHHHGLDKSHHSSGHGYHGDNSVHGDSGHKAHKQYEVSGHKEHSSKAGHHDEHDRHHNRAHYEHDRGYHYEKAYAYDRVRAHHDIGSNKGSHSGYQAQHSNEGHKDVGNHGGQSYVYFKKNDHHGEHGHHDKNSLYKGGHHANGQGYHDYELKYLPHHHAYGK